MEDNKLIKYESGQLSKVSNVIAITNKILNLVKVETLLIPYRKGDKWGFCREDKSIVIDCVYDWVYPFMDGIAIVCLINKWKFIDINGNDVLLTSYDNISKFLESIDTENKTNDTIDLKNKEDITSKYQMVYTFSENLIQVKLNDKWGYINNKGKEYWEV